MMEATRSTGGHPSVADWKRKVRGLGKQIDDADAVRQAFEIMAELEVTIAESIQRLQAEEGYSWTDLGSAVGVSRQAMRQRWGKAIER